jgi:RNA polymerase sigma-70 factor (ECF subfamily)
VDPADFTDDEVLVRALVARSPDAFAFLLDRYQASLVRLAGQYVPNRAVAEEVVQETWLAVIKGIDGFEARSSLKTWLFRIMINLARSKGVKEKRSIPFASMAAMEQGPAVDPRRFRRFGAAAGTWKRPPKAWSEPEQSSLDLEMLAFVESEIAQLPPAQREVVTMRDVLGWTSAEVCDALELAEGNQRVLLHRARSKLRGALERHYGAGGGR